MFRRLKRYKLFIVAGCIPPLSLVAHNLLLSKPILADTDMQSMKRSDDKEIIVVTGGAGFLGKHIVKLLAEKKRDTVKEIRVFDKRPYQNCTDVDQHTNIPIKSYIGDVTKINDVRAACVDADAVIHTAGLVSFGTFPDYNGMENVNVKGTANVIQACVENNVGRLVYTSTIDVVVGYDDICDGTEEQHVPGKFLFPGYPATKLKAENLVLLANGRKLAEGETSRLRTLSLRPNVMYGEGDPYYVTNAIRSAHNQGGELTRVGDGKSLFQQAYVGNMAWAHIAALEALKTSKRPAGQVYFISDDTPVMNSFKFMEPFLLARGLKLSSYSLPYPLVYGALWATEWLLWFISPVYKYNMSTPLCSLIYINRNLYFRRDKADRELGYKPLYTWEQSRLMSLEFYKKVKLTNM